MQCLGRAWQTARRQDLRAVERAQAIHTGTTTLLQVVALFLGSVIAGSFFNQLKQLINAPQSIIQILGVAIPVTSTFFINYILVAGAVVYSL